MGWNFVITALENMLMKTFHVYAFAHRYHLFHRILTMSFLFFCMLSLLSA